MNNLIANESESFTPQNQIENEKDFPKKARLKFNLPFLIVLILGSVGYVLWYVQVQENLAIKENLMIVPYQPNLEEIAQLEGIWSYYTSAPHARANEKDRYHKIVNNVMEISYKDGYFVFKRHGATINHSGYIQYDSPGEIQYTVMLIEKMVV